MPKFTKYTIKPVPAAVQNVQRKSPIHGVKFSRVLIVFCAVAICLFGIAFLRSITSISALQRDDLFTSDTPAYIEKHDEKRVNILLAGVGGKNHDGGYLTDSIMLVSLDTTTSSITMFSIPRDLFVAYPAGGGGRINALYDIGRTDKVGTKYLREKVSEITGQMVDYSIVIDFSGFQKIVDALGGIEIDVPESIVDTQYPTIYDSYETFRISRGLQVLDGKTALKYARSRHSTNDFSRSIRQQLVIRAIRERVLSLGYLTNTTKISDTYDIVSEHIDTDLSIDQMINLALHAKDIPPASIRTVGIHGECTSASVCRAGGYLYTPSRDMFGGASILLPENAIATKVSYYEDIRRLASLVLSYPDILSAEPDVVVVNASKIKNAGANVQLSLAKLGFPFLPSTPPISSTGTISTTAIYVYWDPDTGVGFDEKNPITLALRTLMPEVSVVRTPGNIYSTKNGPKIEIVLGTDYVSALPFAKAPTYLPIVSKNFTGTDDKKTTNIPYTGTENTLSSNKKVSTGNISPNVSPPRVYTGAVSTSPQVYIENTANDKNAPTQTPLYPSTRSPVPATVPVDTLVVHSTSELTPL